MERSEEPSKLGSGSTRRPRTPQKRDGSTATSTERPVQTGPHRKVSSKDIAGPLHTPFQAGKQKMFIEELKKLTTDEFILDMASGLTKTILQGRVKGGRRKGRQKKRWEDNIMNEQAWSSASPRGQWSCLLYTSDAADE